MHRIQPKIIGVLAVFSLVFLGSAKLKTQAPQNPVLSKYFVVPKDEATMLKIAERFEVEHRHGNGFDILVPVPEKTDFLLLAPDAQLIETDISAVFKHRGGAELKGFHNFESVKTHLDRIVSQYPEVASQSTYGESMEGRPLHVLRLLTKNGPASKPQLVITSATHGNEIITVEVVFGLIDSLVQGYGRDSRITNMLDKHELYFLPVINPDGYIRKERYANGVDPNRDYPWPEKPEKSSNPCIKNVMQFFQSHDIKGSLDFHSAGGMIMYPWAYTYDAVAGQDKAAFDTLTRKMAAHNGYTYGPISKVIYVAKGSSADYYYWKFQSKSLGIEISEHGSASQIPTLVKENMESTWTFIESF